MVGTALTRLCPPYGLSRWDFTGSSLRPRLPVLEQMNDRVRAVLQQHELFRVGAVGVVGLDHQMAQRQHPQADGDGVVAVGARDVNIASEPLEVADQG